MRSKKAQRLVALFLAFGALLNYPLFYLFAEREPAGFPDIFAAAFLLWLLMIVLLGLVADTRAGAE
jgi:hypothetical protein